MRQKTKLSWSDLQDGANVAERRGFARHTIMKEITRHTDGMNTEQKRDFVEQYFDRSKNLPEKYKGNKVK